MKKLLSDWEWLSIRILVLGATVFFWSYLTEIEGAREFFGDSFYQSRSWSKAEWHWGFRHWVYTITFTLITGVQAARIIKWIVKKEGEGGFKVKT